MPRRENVGRKKKLKNVFSELVCQLTTIVFLGKLRAILYLKEGLEKSLNTFYLSASFITTAVRHQVD